ncbi:SpaH/EbpB family LPXTG-anchored major pilin [Leucobacter sp. HY1910]
MSSPKKLRGLLATAAAAATALLLAVGGATAAHADPIIPDSGATGTLNIHKYEQPDTPGTPGNGLAQDMTGKTALEGVTFEVRPIETVDLSTNAGWQAAAAISYDAATNTVSGSGSDGQPATIGSPVGPAQTTDGDGLATFADLPIGLYLVTETQAPAGVTKAAPFLVTVPLTHPEALDTWMYDIHVYPKNSTSKVTKSVEDEAGVAVGDAIAWTILGDIPRTANPDYVAGPPAVGEPFLAPTGYKITDKLDPRLGYASAQVTLTGAGAPALAAGDYTVTPADSTNDNTVTVLFTPAGLAKLGQAAAIPGAQVQLVLGTTVNYLDGDATNGVGTITNKAIVFPNEGSFDKEPGEPDGPIESNEPETRWGDILIEKVAAGKPGVKLEDAKFQVFASEQAALQQQDPIEVNGETTFVTDSDGVVRISGLRYSDFADGEAQLPYIDAAGDQTGDVDEREDDNPKYRVYWLVEVESPDGYELLANPVPVIVNQANQVVGAAGTTVIENAPHNAGFELPLTGAAGTWMFTIAGLVLIGGGLVVASKRKKARA